MTENIEYIDDAVNGIECIDDGKFTVTEERLRELLENEVIKNLYDMNVDAPGSCMFGIESLYPSYGNAPDIVADTLIGIITERSRYHHRHKRLSRPHIPLPWTKWMGE